MHELLSIIAPSHRLKLCVSLHRIPTTINHLNIEARVRGTKARLFPGFHRNIVFGGAMV